MLKATSKLALVLIFSISVFALSIAQTTKIRGIVKDAETGDPIAFASVYIKGTSVFAYTNDSGAYSISTKLKVDSISVSFLGYRSQSEIITRRVTQVINFNLVSNVTKLDAIVVTPGENPAHRILRAINKNKEKNALKTINYQCNKYSKVQIALSNIDEKFKNRKVLQPFKFVFDNVDTNAYTGNTYLPILIAETSSDFYYQKSPLIQRETVQATKISGIQNESVLSFLGGLNQSFNIYDDYMNFYSESGFVSPISGSGLLFYKYYLLDSAIRDGHKCYNISFKPRRKQERTFIGDFWVADSCFAIRSMNMRINPQANLNFITDMYAEYNYSCVNDSIWIINREYIQADLNLAEIKRLKGLQGTKTIIYSNYKINEPIPDDIINRSDQLVISDSASSPGTIDKLRPVQLSTREANVYKMVDSIKNVPAFKTAYDIIQTIVEAHYTVDKFKIGPYFSLYSYNEVEGHRFRIGGTTNAKFSEKIQFTGYTAYGTYDKEFKYYGELLWIIKKNPFIRLTSIIRHDVGQVNLDPGESLNENIISSFIRRNSFTKLQMMDNAKFVLETDIVNGITNQLSANLIKIHPSKYIPLARKIDSASVASVNAVELGVGFHIESGQKFFNSRFRRLRLRNDNPAFDVNVTAGLKNFLHGEHGYMKYSIKMSHFLKTNPFGFNKYSVEIGKMTGKAPWPLLNVLRGNETYGLSNVSFNMMNYYEFVANEYITVFSEQHFQGIILNYLPLMRKLKLREVASFKAAFGRLDAKNYNDLLLPTFMHGLDKPYIEAGIGLENIFKFIRVDALWRFTQLNHPDIEIFGLRIRLHFML
jgi:hypothetical protein